MSMEEVIHIPIPITVQDTATTVLCPFYFSPSPFCHFPTGSWEGRKNCLEEQIRPPKLRISHPCSNERCKTAFLRAEGTSGYKAFCANNSLWLTKLYLNHQNSYQNLFSCLSYPKRRVLGLLVADWGHQTVQTRPPTDPGQMYMHEINTDQRSWYYGWGGG